MLNAEKCQHSLEFVISNLDMERNRERSLSCQLGAQVKTDKGVGIAGIQQNLDWQALNYALKLHGACCCCAIQCC